MKNAKERLRVLSAHIEGKKHVEGERHEKSDCRYQYNLVDLAILLPVNCIKSICTRSAMLFWTWILNLPTFFRKAKRFHLDLLPSWTNTSLWLIERKSCFPRRDDCSKRIKRVTDAYSESLNSGYSLEC